MDQRTKPAKVYQTKKLRDDWNEFYRRANKYLADRNELKDLKGIEVSNHHNILKIIFDSSFSSHNVENCQIYKNSASEKVFHLISQNKLLIYDPCFLKMYYDALIYGDKRFFNNLSKALKSLQQSENIELNGKPSRGRPTKDTDYKELRWFVIEFLRNSKSVSECNLEECFYAAKEIINEEPKIFIKPIRSDSCTDHSLRVTNEYLRSKDAFVKVAEGWYSQWKKHQTDFWEKYKTEHKDVELASKILATLNSSN